MQNILIGDYIKQRRKELKLTQEQVCDGICDPVSLSRIENGKQTPKRSIINALLQRLGLPDARYYALASESELKMEALTKEIIGCTITCKVNIGFQKIEELQKEAEPDDTLTQQFILRSKAILGALDKRYSSEEQLALLLQAIHLTVPNFDLEEINQHLYTFDEVKAIVQIANVYSNFDQNEKAADIFSQLLKYVRKHYQEVITSGGLFPMILFNYARVLDLCGRYKEGKQLAEEGKNVCIQYGQYQTLPGCLEIYAECCHFMGEDNESAEAYCEAYYLCKVIGRQEDLEIIKAEAKKYLGIEFTQYSF